MNNYYKRLGDYIRLVDVRNKDLEVTNLLGLSVEKCFFPSIANTIGTDMSTYKIINNNQFVYIADTSRRGDKIAVALYKGNDKSMVSQAYTVFEVEDSQVVCPDYLMMWFRRPEFDRYARFKSHGSAREIFGWEDMCDVMLPLPDIERQRELVAEYECLTRRIRINEQLCTKLEETAQALYRKMFVDGIDKDHLPAGWRMGTLGEIIDFVNGGDWGKEYREGNYDSIVHCIRGADIKSIRGGSFNDVPTRYILKKNLESRVLRTGDVVVEMSGGSPTQSTGRTLFISKSILSLTKYSIICSNFCKVIHAKKGFKFYIFMIMNYLYNKKIMFKYENSSNGLQNLDLSSMMRDEKIILPTSDYLKENSQVEFIYDFYTILGEENCIINSIKSTILSQLSN